MSEKWILGIYISDRAKESSRVQYILTKFGCSIRTRLGINPDADAGHPGQGLILLELTGEQPEFQKLMAELSAIGHIQVEKMVFRI